MSDHYEMQIGDLKERIAELEARVLKQDAHIKHLHKWRKKKINRLEGDINDIVLTCFPIIDWSANNFSWQIIKPIMEPVLKKLAQTPGQ